MSQRRRVQLRHIAQMRYGDSLGADSRRDGSIKVFGSNGPVDVHDVANTHGPVIVVGRKGSYGKLQWSSSAVFAIDTTYFIDDGCTSANLRWLYFALQTANLDTLSQDVGVPGLSREQAYSQRLSLPSLDEQRAIADFLDAETARIDALIEKKRRLLRLLEGRFAAHVEQRTQAALVSENEGEALPDSWRSIILRRCFGLIQYGIGEASRETGAIAVLGMGNVDRGEIVGKPSGFVDELDPALLLESGDLLFNRTNSLALVGKVALVRSSAATTFASYLVRLRTNGLADSNYLNYLLNTRPILGQARSMALPSIGQANLNPSRYTSIRIPLPPIQVQRSISRELDKEAAIHSKLSASLTRQMQLLVEHRQALITAAVTGEIGVQGAAAGLHSVTVSASPGV